MIVPDVWIGWVGLTQPRRAMPAAAAACAGALVGASVLYAFARLAAGPTADLVAALPGLDREDLARVSAQLRADGLVAVVRAPLSGMPVKVYVVEAARLGVPLSRLLPAVAVNRLVRIGLVGSLSAVAGRRWAGPLARRRGRALALYATAWSVFYAAYFASR